MPDKGVQCCLNDSHIAHISAEITYLRKVIDNLKDEMDGYSNQWLHDYNKIIAKQIFDMTELVLQYGEEAPASASVYRNTSNQ